MLKGCSNEKKKSALINFVCKNVVFVNHSRKIIYSCHCKKSKTCLKPIFAIAGFVNPMKNCIVFQMEHSYSKLIGKSLKYKTIKISKQIAGRTLAKSCENWKRQTTECFCFMLLVVTHINWVWRLISINLALSILENKFYCLLY